MKKILWADDEIDYLKPHLLFLKEKGYEVTPVVSGVDVIDLLKETPLQWDVVMLDENMPGLSGIETLAEVRRINADVPVVMITKSEEEDLMDKAVGNRIDDFLIKPVNPRQILLTLKKILEAPRLVTEQSASSYRREFLDIDNEIRNASSFAHWAALYRRLVSRTLDLEENAPDIAGLLQSQYKEAETGFMRFVKNNYASWIGHDNCAAPLMSHEVLEKIIEPALLAGERPVLLLLDNFRLDQWLTVRPVFSEHFTTVNENLYCSLLPTATQYARNALLSGMLPFEIEARFPELWVDEDAPESKNLNEEPLIKAFLERNALNHKTVRYYKANDSENLNTVIKNFGNDKSDFTVIVVNFIDILSHSKADSRMMRELASTDAAYRSLTLSWFRHSPILELLDKIRASQRTLFVTTDHGSILVETPLKVIADKNTNTALRYKVGKNLGYDPKRVMAATKPAEIGLPSPNISSTYIFAGEGDFFLYPNNYNHYANMFKDTYQHGGVSMEEMIVPVVKLQPRL